MANAKQPPKDRRSRPTVPKAGPAPAEPTPDVVPAEAGQSSEAEDRRKRSIARTEQEAEARLEQIYLQNEAMGAERKRIEQSARLARASAIAEKGRAFMFGSFGAAALAFAAAVLTGGAP